MSTAYRAVGWNRQKARYDVTIVLGVLAYLTIFILGGSLGDTNATIETLVLRGCGACALFLLHVVLAIGPLCRLDRRFLPLLYNRRHLGVTMFTVALAHGTFAIVQFHAGGSRNPIVSVLTSGGSYASVSGFPFQGLGLVALMI